MAQKVGAVETAAEFLRRRAGDAKVEDLKAFMAMVPDAEPMPGDELPILRPTLLLPRASPVRS